MPSTRATLAALLLLAVPALVHAQSYTDRTQVLHAQALHPPAGARVALLEFAEEQCSACALVNPTLKAAAAQHHIPWVRYDFPLPFHSWSFDAAVNARWFDTHSKQLGDAYRDAVFANLNSLYSPGDLHTFTLHWAQAHKLSFPSPVDPSGKLASLVRADVSAGQALGIQRVPTTFVVTSSGYKEVLDPSRLDEMINTAAK